MSDEDKKQPEDPNANKNFEDLELEPSSAQKKHTGEFDEDPLADDSFENNFLDDDQFGADLDDDPSSSVYDDDFKDNLQPDVSEEFDDVDLDKETDFDVGNEHINEEFTDDELADDFSEDFSVGDGTDEWSDDDEDDTDFQEPTEKTKKKFPLFNIIVWGTAIVIGGFFVTSALTGGKQNSADVNSASSNQVFNDFSGKGADVDIPSLGSDTDESESSVDAASKKAEAAPEPQAPKENKSIEQPPMPTPFAVSDSAPERVSTQSPPKADEPLTPLPPLEGMDKAPAQKTSGVSQQTIDNINNQIAQILERLDNSGTNGAAGASDRNISAKLDEISEKITNVERKAERAIIKSEEAVKLSSAINNAAASADGTSAPIVHTVVDDTAMQEIAKVKDQLKEIDKRFANIEKYLTEVSPVIAEISSDNSDSGAATSGKKAAAVPARPTVPQTVEDQPPVMENAADTNDSKTAETTVQNKEVAPAENSAENIITSAKQESKVTSIDDAMAYREQVVIPVMKPAVPESIDPARYAAPKYVPAKKIAKHVVKKEPAPAWILRAAQPGKAWVSLEGQNDIKAVEVGDTLKGVGTITSVSYRYGTWIVEGTQGRIKQ